MKSDAPLWITEAEVVGLLSLREAIDALEHGLLLEARGEAQNMAKTHVGWGQGNTLHAIGATVPGVGFVGTKTWKPTVAGILDIAGAIIWTFVSVILMDLYHAGSGPGFLATDDVTLANLAAGAIIAFVLAAVAVAGGISGLQRKNWGLALTGSIAAALPGLVLGIFAIVFLAMSKQEFT